MRKQYWLAIILMCAVPVQASAHQKTPDIYTLYTQLRDPSVTNRAAQQIVRSARRDTNARDYISEKLPEIIEKAQMDQVWRNAVRLAGQLQASNSVPALIRVLPRSPFKPSVILFGEMLSLDSDPVGEALREIGDPAVPALADLLEHGGDSMDRWRAARILWNIDSPLSHKVMHHDLQNETDPAIKQFTEGKSHA
jgi:hypothetical protein